MTTDSEAGKRLQSPRFAHHSFILQSLGPFSMRAFQNILEYSCQNLPEYARMPQTFCRMVYVVSVDPHNDLKTLRKG